MLDCRINCWSTIYEKVAAQSVDRVQQTDLGSVGAKSLRSTIFRSLNRLRPTVLQSESTRLCLNRHLSVGSLEPVRLVEFNIYISMAR